MFYMPRIKVGDEVTINSGGPVMLVSRVIGIKMNAELSELDEVFKEKYGAVDGDLICQWVVGEEKCYGPFPMAILKKTD